MASRAVAKAFALSLLFHLCLFGVVEIGYRLGWWRQNILSQLFNRTAQARHQAEAKDEKSNQIQEVPLVFVEVDPVQASEQAPEQAKYYSARDSVAANPETRIESTLPEITGVQDKVPKTIDQPRVEPMPEPPPPPMAETKPEPQPLQPALPPEIAPEPGELARAKPAEEKPKVLTFSEALPTVPPVRTRPRTLAQARQQSGLIGERMKQEGGVKRFSLEASLDVRATPFGAYDAAIIAAIQQHWYNLLDQRDFARNFSGKVVVTFRLNYDGTVTNMSVIENEVTEILAVICERAIREPSPYARWPSDLRRRVGTDYREVRFTFHYN